MRVIAEEMKEPATKAITFLRKAKRKADRIRDENGPDE
jgi:hypothetical protein